jgi:hypothetical protein
MLEPAQITYQVTEALEKIGTTYFIGGSLASTFYGLVRTTQDSDIVTMLKQEQVPMLVELLSGDFYVDDLSIYDAIQHQSSFNIIHRESLFKVDLFIPPLRLFTENQFKRATREPLLSNSDKLAYIASAEDTLLAKLEWFRMGGEVSERQWHDVLGVLKVQGETLD